jgi:hypothetical protein
VVSHRVRPTLEADAADAAVLKVQVGGARPELEVDAEPLQVPAPGRDPRVVGRAVEQPIDALPWLPFRA